MRAAASLGWMDELQPKHLKPLITGSNGVIGRAESTAAPVEYDSALAFGDVYALHELWVSLGFRDVVRGARRRRGASSTLSRWCGQQKRDSHFLETAIRPVIEGGITHRLHGLFVENGSATGSNSTDPIGLPPRGVASCPTGNAGPRLSPSLLQSGAAELGARRCRRVTGVPAALVET